MSGEPIVLVREGVDDSERPSVRNARRGLMILDAYRKLTGSDVETDAADLVADVLHAVTARPENEGGSSALYVLEQALRYFETDDEDYPEEKER